MENSQPKESSSLEAVFRPTKRRKFLRKRLDSTSAPYPPSMPSDSLPHGNEAASPQPCTMEDDDVEDNEVAISEILRFRKAAKARRGGIGFTNHDDREFAAAGAGLDVQQADQFNDENETDPVKLAARRFMPHTGLVANVDKHMMEYIDKEMARRYQVDSMSHSAVTTGAESSTGASNRASAHAIPPPLPQRQPAAIGKLHEIDLGPDSTLRNIARTEAAARGEPLPDDDSQSKGKAKKGWANRRRTSQDDIRDRLVEEVLRESRLDIYDPTIATASAGVSRGNGNNAGEASEEAADDRIAEQFRREFLDAIQSRRQRAQRVRQSRSGKTGTKSESRGPKLGGSRSARAAMREREMKRKGKK